MTFETALGRYRLLERKGISMLDPISIYREARKSNPVLDLAFAVAGLAAIASIIIGFVGSGKLAIISISLLFIAMLLFLVISYAINKKNSIFTILGNVVIICTALFFITLLFASAGALLIGKPCYWAKFLELEADCGDPITFEDNSVCGAWVTAYSGGRGEPNPGCPDGNATACVNTNGSIVQGSAYYEIKGRTERTSIKIGAINNKAVCYNLNAHTGACEIRVSITARACAVERISKSSPI